MNMMMNVPKPSTPLHAFCGNQVDALRNAAGLLAGPRGDRLVEDITEALARSGTLSRRTIRNLLALHRLLTLQGTEDPASDEATRFAMIDPCDPVVEEVCLLADGLLDALRAYADFEPDFELDVAA
jgi:hypothetical protein